MLARVVRPERLQGVGLQFAAVMLAFVLAIGLVTGLLELYGISAARAIPTVLDHASRPSSIVATVNKATTYYLAGIAAAIGFRTLLFNIGIDGQYRLAVFAAASVGAALSLPPVLQVPLLIAIAVLVGAVFAAIPGYLKATRGVSEVISTIMLNAVASGIIAYLLSPGRLAERVEGSNNLQTPKMATSGWVPGIPFGSGTVYGLLPLAVLVGLAYWLVTTRTVFGFDLTTAASSPRAAQVAGVDPRRVVLVTMIVSGAAAGLIGLPELLGSTHAYGLSFPAGLGWAGLSIAILGRNHPVGVAVGALLWAWMERAAQPLDILGVPKEIVAIAQGTIVLCVVVAYELVRRWGVRQAQRQAAAADRPAALGAGPMLKDPA